MKVADAKKQKDNLYAALSRDLSDFEKNFLLIAAGVLTFSITFIKDIVNIAEACCLVLLFLGWGGFALAVGLMMFTLIRSAYASDEISFAIEDYLRQNDKWEPEEELDRDQSIAIRQTAEQIFRKRKKQLKRLRYWAIGAFLAGFVFFGVFVAGNLLHEAGAPQKVVTKFIIDSASRSVTVDGWKMGWKDSTVSIEKVATEKSQ